MAHDKPKLWLHVLDKLLEGGAQTRGSKDLINFVDNLVNAYETRFVGPSEEEPTKTDDDLKKQMADHR